MDRNSRPTFAALAADEERRRANERAVKRSDDDQGLGGAGISKTRITSPAFLLAGALILGVVGTILLAITADEGGYRMYHPFDVLGLSIDAVAALLLVASVWRFLHREKVR